MVGIKFAKFPALPNLLLGCVVKSENYSGLLDLFPIDNEDILYITLPVTFVFTPSHVASQQRRGSCLVCLAAGV